MFLKMNAFKALTKKAYNATGLTVGNDGEGIYLMGGYWSIWLERTMMPKKAKAAIIELIGSIPAPGRAAAFYKSDDTNWEERDLLPEEVYRPDTTYFKTAYKDTDIRIRTYRRELAVLQNRSTMECVILPEHIVSMIDSGSREKEEGPVSLPLGNNRYSIWWQNEACTLKCDIAIAEGDPKEEFILQELEKWDFTEKRKVTC